MGKENLVKSCLKFHGYNMKKVHYEIVEAKNDNHEFIIAPIFNKDILKIDEELYQINLGISISSSEDNPLPFNIEIEMVGEFEICLQDENEILKDTLLNENAVAIMFPFLRSAVASLTTLANIPPLILPVTNFALQKK